MEPSKTKGIREQIAQEQNHKPRRNVEIGIGFPSDSCPAASICRALYVNCSVSTYLHGPSTKQPLPTRLLQTTLVVVAPTLKQLFAVVLMKRGLER